MTSEQEKWLENFETTVKDKYPELSLKESSIVSWEYRDSETQNFWEMYLAACQSMQAEVDKHTEDLELWHKEVILAYKNKLTKNQTMLDEAVELLKIAEPHIRTPWLNQGNCISNFLQKYEGQKESER